MYIGGNPYKLNLASCSSFFFQDKKEINRTFKLYIMQNIVKCFIMYNALCISD